MFQQDFDSLQLLNHNCDFHQYIRFDQCMYHCNMILKFIAEKTDNGYTKI